jgi:NAD(P)-dependent dehydrogenase (short-subunit alcohol dehydrogenase family)
VTDRKTDGTLALVTGAGSGIGRATATRLAARGLTVLCVGRTLRTLRETVARIEAEGGAAEALAADCAQPEAVAAVRAAVGSRPVQALVFCAAVDPVQDFADATRGDFDRVMALNVASPFFLTQALLPAMTDDAAVVFVGSVAARAGLHRHALYGASKAALLGLTVNLACELAPAIRVNCVSPGATRTGMLDDYLERSMTGLSEKVRQRRQTASAARQLLRRIVDPDEVARTIEHLALDATAVTGIEVPVDAGYSAS